MKNGNIGKNIENWKQWKNANLEKWQNGNVEKWEIENLKRKSKIEKK